jgi:hypothetical protein
MNPINPTPDQMKEIEARIDSSPIKGLIRNFQGSPFAGAPERRLELDQMMIDLGVRIQLSWPGTSFTFHVADERFIRVGLCALERLWAYAYGYYKSYLLVGNNPPATLINQPRDIADLLRWAHSMGNSPIESPWPTGTARPDRADSGDQISPANELFLVMSAWILLHEFGHIVRQDRYDPGVDGRDHNHAIEFAADDWAYRFLMDRWQLFSEQTDVFLKRGIGVAFAIFILAANRFYRGGVVNSNTHPHPVERLLRYFEYLEQKHPKFRAEVLQIQYAACVCLFGTVGPHVPEDELQTNFSKPRDCVEYLKQYFVPIAI